MNFKKISALLIILNCFIISGQGYVGVKAPFINTSFDSFKAGESLKFRIHYGFFNASYATLELSEEVLNKIEVNGASGLEAAVRSDPLKNAKIQSKIKQASCENLFKIEA